MHIYIYTYVNICILKYISVCIVMFAIVMFGGVGFGVRGLEFGDEGFRIELLVSNSSTVSALVERSGRHLLKSGVRCKVQRIGILIMRSELVGMHARKHHGVL